VKNINAKYKRSISDAQILLVDDEPINCEIMQHMLGDLYQVSSVHSGEDALALSQSNNLDLILLDVMMPGMSGIETCRRIKANEDSQHIPIIFITGLQDEQQEAECWDVGAVDFVAKPVNGVELRNRVRAHLTHKLQTDHLRTLSYVDKLTRTYNRHFLEDAIPNLEKQSKRSNLPVSVMMVDIDCFKLYNDHFGHLQGDHCLRTVADEIAEVLHRPVDLLIRFGGEEFMVILIDTDNDGAMCVAKNIIAKISQKNIPHPKSLFTRVSVSIGVATYEASGSDNQLEDIIHQADKHLYQAKTLGRNQVRG
jgi:diguanylate cyclase (GGDEF)-like protein